LIVCKRNAGLAMFAASGVIVMEQVSADEAQKLISSDYVRFSSRPGRR